jgi:hypothetical protein
MAKGLFRQDSGADHDSKQNRRNEDGKPRQRRIVPPEGHLKHTFGWYLS